MHKGFVLSTGRTGTMAISSLLVMDKNVIAPHEPSPSRRFYFLSRFVAEHGDKYSTFLANYYFKKRRKFLQDNRDFIEINPFYVMSGHAMHSINKKTKILHVVRDINTYLPSRINFKAKKWHKHVIDFVPYYHWNIRNFYNNEIFSWSKLNRIEREAWRWVYINRKIEENRKFNYYLRIKFEDLFLASEKTQMEILIKINNFFELKIPIKKALLKLNDKKNTSKRNILSNLDNLNEQLKISVLSITNNLRNHYGYI